MPPHIPPPAPTAAPPIPAPAAQPAFADIKKFQQISGLSRSAIYRAMNSGQLIGRKHGKRVLIDVTAGLAWLHGMPLANTRPPAP